MSTNGNFPPPHVISPKDHHTYTIIFLHGRNSSGKELAEDLFEGQTSSNVPVKDTLTSVKWIFPNAPERYSSVFQEDLTEWFDIYSLSDTDAERERQIDGLSESINYIRNIIEEESRAVPIERIILGGISQGFAVASHVLLSSKCSFGGFLGFCGWIPFQTELDQIVGNQMTLLELFESRLGLQGCTSTLEPVQGIPVLIGHSKGDEVVDFSHGTKACNRLRDLGFKSVEFHAYDDDEHWIAEPHGYDDLVAFLKSV